MARNGLARVNWDIMGPRVLTWLREYLVGGHGTHHAQVNCALAFHGTFSVKSLSNYLHGQGQERWAAIKAEAEELARLREAETPPPTPPPAKTEPVPDLDPTHPELRAKERAVTALADQLEEVRAKLRDADREANLKDFLTALARETAPKLPPPPKVYEPPKREGMVVETASVVLSDWHLYENVSAERTRGLNEYSAEIGAQRVSRFVAKHGSIVQRMRKGGWEFPELLVFLGGDFHPGTIHELERHASDGANAVTACYGTAYLLALVLRDLSALYPKVYVAGVPGNHGRLPDARRMQQKDPTRNWDYLIYLIASEMLRDIKHMDWFLPDSYAAQVECRGYNFLLGHGHEIRSWSGIPWYGIERYVRNITAVEASRGQTVHYHLLGHFHEQASIPHAAGETFINGSVIGANEFVVNALGKVGTPSQLMFGIHAEHGVTHRWPIRLDKEVANAPLYPWTPWRGVQNASTTLPETRVWKVGP